MNSAMFLDIFLVVGTITLYIVCIRLFVSEWKNLREMQKEFDRFQEKK